MIQLLQKERKKTRKEEGKNIIAHPESRRDTPFLKSKGYEKENVNYKSK